MRTKVTGFLIFTFTFLLFLFPANSLDLGWHLRYGEYFWKHGTILKENVFSSTFASYQWINHSWFFDVITYPLFQRFGFMGLSVGAAALAGLLALLLWRDTKKVALPLMLVGLVISYPLIKPLFAHGLRAQLFSLVGFAVVSYVLRRYKTVSRKILVAIAFLFILLANLHGQFMLALGLPGLVIVGKIIDERRITWKSIQVPLFILLVGSVVSIFNPFGVDTHLESFRYLSYPYLSLIAEWAPWITGSFEWWILCLYTGFVGWHLWSRGVRTWEVWLPFGFFAFQAFTRRRMVPFFTILTFPYLIESLKTTALTRLNITSLRTQFIFTALLSTVLVVGIIPGRRIYLKNWEDYCGSSISLRCSEAAAQYLREHPLSGKVFNYYNWGGYLIARAPEQKFYIDGRMTMWNNNGYSPLERHDQIYYMKPKAKEYWQQEQFDAAIIQSGIPLEQYLVSEKGWKTTYRDRDTVVLLKP